MGTMLNGLTVAEAVVQGTAATLDSHLVRLGEAREMAASLFAGCWDPGTTYAKGVVASHHNALWLGLAANNLAHAPASSPAWWLKILEPVGGGSMADLDIHIAAGSEANLDATLGTDLTTVDRVDFVFQRVTPTEPKDSGYEIDLTEQASVSVDASVLDAASGKVRCTLTGEHTATPGVYRGQFQFMVNDELKLHPANGWIELEVLAAVVEADGCHLYVAHARDCSGSGFSLAPSDDLPYLAIRTSMTPLIPQAADFAGRWIHLRGTPGQNGNDGTPGINGTAAFLSVAWASAPDGTGFSTAPGPGLFYRAEKVTSSPIVSPTAADFAGLWLNVRGVSGANGENGNDGADGASVFGMVAYAADEAGYGFSTTPAPGLNYVAIRVTATEIAEPQASDFTGLWRRYAIDSAEAVPDDTDGLTEGSRNLYFTAARVLASALASLSGTVVGDVANGDSILMAVSKLQNRLKTAETALASPGQALFAEGTIPVGNGEQAGTLSSLSLGFTPSRVQLTLSAPAGAAVLSAVVVGDPTVSGFAWSLSAATAVAGYRLHYRVT